MTCKPAKNVKVGLGLMSALLLASIIIRGGAPLSRIITLVASLHSIGLNALSS